MRYVAAVGASVLFMAACTAAPPSDAELAAVRDAGLCGRIEEADALLAPHLAAHGGEPHVALLAGDLAVWRGEPDEGLAWYRRAAESAPDSADPHLHTAYVHLTLSGDTAAARTAADAARRALGLAAETSAALLACEGELAWQAGEPVAAEDRFRDALEAAPGCRWALQRLVQIVPVDDAEHDTLRERLERAIAAGKHGEGMSAGRSPVTFCGE